MISKEQILAAEESRRLQNLDLEQRLAQGAPLLRDRLCSVPFYAKRAAKREQETGDPMSYWNELWSCTPNIGVPLKASSTAEKA